MDLKRKRQLKKNIVMFFVWLVLIWISGVYLSNNSAEKVAVVSWFQVMWQKAVVVFENIIGDNGELLERKYEMITYFKELIKVAKHNKCVGEEVLNELNEAYDSLCDLKISELTEVLPMYEELLYELDQSINNDDCEN